MKTIFIIFFCSVSLHGLGQNEHFYALNKGWKPTSLDSGIYLLWIHKTVESNWQFDYYNMYGPLIRTETFEDENASIPNGRFSIYNKTGNLDSTGRFEHGKRQGSFYKLRTFSEDSVRYIMQYDYVEDSLVKTIDLLAKAPEKKNEMDNDSTKESEYNGGLKKWQAYLSNRLNYPVRAMNKEIQGQVIVNFLVDEKGMVQYQYIQKSCEYSLDQESIRIIMNSGKWIPGKKDGINTKTYKCQPINYKLR